MEKITIARSGRIVEPSKVTLPIQMFNTPTNVLKIGLIKWEISFYADVLSNPKLENVNEVFRGYKQVVNVYTGNDGMATAEIFLIAGDEEVPVMPTWFTPICNLVFDRQANAMPISYGLVNGYVVEHILVPSQMSL